MPLTLTLTSILTPITIWNHSLSSGTLRTLYLRKVMLVSITPKMFTWSGKFRRENCDIPFPQELDPYYPPVWLQLQESQPFITLKGGGPGNIQNLSSKPDQYHTIYISLSPSSDHLRSLKLTTNTKLISLSHLIPILNSNSTPPQP